MQPHPKKRKTLLGLCLLLCGLLAGCSPALDASLPVIVLALDQKEDKLTMTLKVAAANGKDGDDGYLTISSEGTNTAEAFTSIQRDNAYLVSLSSVRLVILGSKVAQNLDPGDMEALLGQGLRGSATVVVSDDPCDKAMEALKVPVGLRLSRYLDEKCRSAIHEGLIPHTTAFTVWRDTKAGLSKTIAARCRIKGGQDQMMDDLAFYTKTAE